MTKPLMLAAAFLSMAAFATLTTITSTQAKQDLDRPSMVSTPEDEGDGTDPEGGDPDETAEKRAKQESSVQKRDARNAWEKVTKVDESLKKVAESIADLLKGIDRTSAEGKAEVVRLYGMQREMQKPLTALKNERIETFVDTFAETELNTWNAKEDGPLMEEGIYQLAGRKLEHAPVDAISLYETLLEKVPDSKYTGAVYNYRLPAAIMATDDYEGGKAKLSKLAKDCTADNIYAFAVLLGEFEAIHGYTDAALKIWNDALATIPADIDAKDRRVRDRNYLSLRANNVGKTAIDIDSKTWLGSEAKPLSAMKGQIVIVDFWATWCGPCIASMPGMNDLRNKYHDKGVEVLGVTRFYANGYLAKSMQELREGKREGESVQKMDEKAFMEHLAQFKENTKCDYPYVVGNAEDFKAYGISGIPTMTIVDRSGKVVYATVGGGKEAVVNLVIKKLLAKDPVKVEEKAPIEEGSMK